MKTKPHGPHASRWGARFRSALAGIAAAGLLSVVSTVSATPFGYAASGGGFIVTNGANLVFTIDSAGDMPSCLYKGTQLNDTAKASCIASGLGAYAVTATNTGSVILITCVSTNITGLTGNPIKQYYIVTNGLDNIYLATYAAAEPTVGELRYIFRGQFNVLPNGPAYSDNNGTTGAIESTDIFGHSNGWTTSKYYGSQRAKDLTVEGATGTGVGVFMAFGNRESDMGGPFVRDIENQGDGAGSDQEIYNYMNSGHHIDLTINGVLENYRTNVLYGPYAYVFTTGSTPSVPDLTLNGEINNLGLEGYVPLGYGSGGSRGQVVLNGIANMSTNPATGSLYQYYMGFANPTAQYWSALGSNGSGECVNMKPGTYNMTIYKNELAVWTNTATVTAGTATTFHTATVTDPSSTATIWRLGDWDGTPLDVPFLNATNIMFMHPSDVRNAKWGPVPFTNGVSVAKSFAASLFRGDNTNTTIYFQLTAAQAAAAHTLNIGITTGYNNGRPAVSVNGNSLSVPGAPTQPVDRSLTTGTYRGDNDTFSWSVPAADFVTGWNSLVITAASGSSDLSPWLSASFAYDCLELDN